MINNYKKYLDYNCVHYQYSSDFCYYRIIKNMLNKLSNSIKPINIDLKITINYKCIKKILNVCSYDDYVSKIYEDYIHKHIRIIELNIILLELYLKEIEHTIKDLKIIKYDAELQIKLNRDTIDFFNIIFSSNTINVCSNIKYTNIYNIMHLGNVKFIYDDSFEIIISSTYNNPTIFDHLLFLHKIICKDDKNEYTYRGYILLSYSTVSTVEYYDKNHKQKLAYIMEKPMINWNTCDYWTDLKNVNANKHICYH